MNEIFLSIEDLKSLLFRLRYKLPRIAALSALLIFFFCLLKKPVYIAEASFRQAATHAEQGTDLKSFAKTILQQETESSAISLMMSQKILRRVIENLGLQVEVSTPKPWTIFDNMRAELKRPLSDLNDFTFRHVRYSGEEPLSFTLRLLSFNTYELLDKKGKRVLAARVGEEVKEKEFQFTLEQLPKDCKVGKKYPFVLAPWLQTLGKYRPFLSIKSSKLDKSILLLSFAHRNRYLASDFLNELMESYRGYLREENHHLIEEQISFLSKRQEDISLDLERTLQQHVSYLKGIVGRTGHIDLFRGITSLSQPQERFTSKLFNVEYELARLQEVHQQHMADNREKMEEASSLLLCLEKGEPLPVLKTTIAGLLNQLKEATSTEETEKAKTYLTAHLRSFINHLHRQEQSVELSSESDFQGIDLEIAKKMYVQYMRQLDNLQVNVHQLQFFLSHIREPDFELSSLCRILNDSITGDLVQKAGALEIQLQDELNRSGKEHERVREALSTQKKFIAHHLSQTIELDKIHIDLIHEKLFALQKSMIDLMKNEKRLLEDRLLSLRENMADIPEKWRIENLLKFKTELTKGIMEGLSQFSESKTLSAHLYQVESKPIDPATVPTTPKLPGLFLFSISGAFLATFLFYLYHLLRSLIQGLPLSINYLKMVNLPVCGMVSNRIEGPFSELLQSDVETLRKAVNFIREKPKQSVICFYGGESRDFSEPLADLLAVYGLKTIVVECDTSTFALREEGPGLWHYLTQQVSMPTLYQKEEHVRYIKMGAYSDQGTELFSKERFSTLLDRLKTEYDYIILFTRAPLFSTEAEVLLKHADATLIAFSDERCEEIHPYVQWARRKENSGITFIKCETGPL